MSRTDSRGTPPLFSLLDHLVFAGPDLGAATELVASLFGVRPAAGGRHPAWGTMNTILSLGPRMYLEIMGPDPQQPPPRGGRPFGLESWSAPRLVTWVARGRDLQAVREAARAVGVELGEVQERSRRRPDGTVLKWSMTDLMQEREAGLVPYFIHWGDSPHPAQGAPGGCRLKSLRAVHPEADRVSGVLLGLGLDLAVERGAAAKLEATIQTPRGFVTLD